MTNTDIEKGATAAPGTERGEMKTVPSSDGTTIAYDAIGEGPTLILVGGAMGDRSFKGFVKLAGLLASDFTVINYDRRGRGDSGDTQPYAVEREIERRTEDLRSSGGCPQEGPSPSLRRHLV